MNLARLPYIRRDHDGQELILRSEAGTYELPVYQDRLGHFLIAASGTRRGRRYHELDNATVMWRDPWIGGTLRARSLCGEHFVHPLFTDHPEQWDATPCPRCKRTSAARGRRLDDLLAELGLDSLDRGAAA